MKASSLVKIIILWLYADIYSLFLCCDGCPLCTQGESVKQTLGCSVLMSAARWKFWGELYDYKETVVARTTFFGNKATILYLISIEVGINDAYPLRSHRVVYHYSLGTECTWTISWEKTHSTENCSLLGKHSPDSPWDIFSISHFTSSLRWNPHDIESLIWG